MWFYVVGPILLHGRVHIHSSVAPERLRSASSAGARPCAFGYCATCKRVPCI